MGTASPFATFETIRAEIFPLIFPEIVTQEGTRPSARSFLVIFPLSLVTVPEVFAKVNSSQFPSRIARSHQISSRRLRILTSYSRPNEVFSSLCFLQFGESLGTASNKQLDLMMNSGKLKKKRRIFGYEKRNFRSISQVQYCRGQIRKITNKVEKQNRQIKHYKRTSFV